MTQNKKVIAWIDVETNGIDPAECSLLQVACLLTDLTPELNLLSPEGYSSTIFYSDVEIETIKAKTSEYVLEMHSETNLWSLLSEGSTLNEVDSQLFEYITQNTPVGAQILLGGNSINLDRNFINAYLPKTAQSLSYQSIDVTTVAILAEAWYGNIVYEKKYTHDAVQDIEESLAQLKFLQKKVFI